jgi:hypothetical protein
MNLTKTKIEDGFRGDDALLCECIRALIELNDDGALVPHGIGGHARQLLAACYHRLSVKKGKPFPRLMWADHDPKNKQTPIAIYDTKAEQHSNRPDLKPLRVRVSLVK